MTKIVITGASGLLGRAFMREFEQADGCDVIGLAFSRAGEKYRKLDLTSPAAIDGFIATEKPDIIIHSAAHRRPDICENDKQATKDLNVEATRNIALAAKNIGAFMIYISTDYVFDGKNPPYCPGDKTNPLNAYGLSKLSGEEVTQEILPDSSAVLRVPILYGPCETLGESAATIIAEAMLDKLSGEETLTYDDWSTRYPTLVDDVAVCAREMVDYRLEHPDFAGIFQFSGIESMTKYGMALRLARIIGFPVERIIPDEGPPAGAPRPKNTALDCSDLNDVGIGLCNTPIEKGFSETLKPFL